MYRSIFAAPLIVAAVASSAQAQFLLVPESNSDVVMAFRASDGSLAHANFLDVGAQASAAGVSSTPIEVLEVGNELWVSDQVADRVWRFDQTGGFLGDIGAGQLNNIRGMEVVGNTVYVAMGSDGTGVAEGIVTIDVPTMSVTGSFTGRLAADISYQDIFAYNGELLVTNSDTGNDGIERYAFDGTFIGILTDPSDGVSGPDFMQQMATRANGNIIAGGFSPPAGVWDFDPDGTSNGIVAALDFGPRGVFELDNGDILWTNGTWLRTDTTIWAEGASFRYITASSVPAPGVATLGLIGISMCMRRRRDG